MDNNIYTKYFRSKYGEEWMDTLQTMYSPSMGWGPKAFDIIYKLELSHKDNKKKDSKDKMIEDLQKENEMLKKELEKYKSNDIKYSEPPYTMSKLLDGLHIDSYQYIDDTKYEINEDIDTKEDEELIINI